MFKIDFYNKKNLKLQGDNQNYTLKHKDVHILNLDEAGLIYLQTIISTKLKEILAQQSITQQEEN